MATCLKDKAFIAVPSAGQVRETLDNPVFPTASTVSARFLGRDYDFTLIDESNVYAMNNYHITICYLVAMSENVGILPDFCGR